MAILLKRWTTHLDQPQEEQDDEFDCFLSLDQEVLKSCEESVASPRRIATFRIDCSSCHETSSAAALFVDGFEKVWKIFLHDCSLLLQQQQQNGKDQDRPFLLTLLSTHFLRRFLLVHVRWSQLDSTLSEELGRQGSHQLLQQLMTYQFEPFCEPDQDELIALQDLAGEISALGNFPLRKLPFDFDEIRSRLPLVFNIHLTEVKGKESEPDDDTLSILIQQVVSDRQTEQKDVGFVMWPSAVVLSRWLVAHPTFVQGRKILEIGAGCGLVGIVAGQLAEPNSVILTDFNSAVLNNLQRNLSLNNISADCVSLDFYMQEKDSDHWVDAEGSSHQQVDLVLAADVICQLSDAEAVARTICGALVPGGRALVVCADSSHRFGVDHFAQACRQCELSVSVKHIQESPDRDAMQSTAGYVPDMKLLLFDVGKTSGD